MASRTHLVNKHKERRGSKKLLTSFPSIPLEQREQTARRLCRSVRSSVSLWMQESVCRRPEVQKIMEKKRGNVTRGGKGTEMTFTDFKKMLQFKSLKKLPPPFFWGGGAHLHFPFFSFLYFLSFPFRGSSRSQTHLSAATQLYMDCVEGSRPEWRLSPLSCAHFNCSCSESSESANLNQLGRCATLLVDRRRQGSPSLSQL